MMKILVLKIFSVFNIIFFEKGLCSLSCRPSSLLLPRMFITGMRLAMFLPATSLFWMTLQRWKSGLVFLFLEGGRPITLLATTSQAMSTCIIWVSLFFQFLKICLLILEREEGGREMERETSIGCLPYMPLPGIEPAIQVRAVTGN